MLNCAMAPSINSSTILIYLIILEFPVLTWHGFNQGIMELKSLCSVNKFDVNFSLKNIGYPLICLVILIILNANTMFIVFHQWTSPLIKGC